MKNGNTNHQNEKSNMPVIAAIVIGTIMVLLSTVFSFVSRYTFGDYLEEQVGNIVPVFLLGLVIFLVLGGCLWFIYFLGKKDTTKKNNSMLKNNEDVTEEKSILEELKDQRAMIHFIMDNLKSPAGSLDDKAKMAIKQLSEEKDTYRKKFDAIREFREQFPLTIAPGYVLYSVLRRETKVNHYSKWDVITDFDGKISIQGLVRDDTQGYQELVELLKQTSSPDDIVQQLCKYDEIFCN